VLPDDADELPSVEDFAAALRSASEGGRGVAIHAVVAGAVTLAVEATVLSGIQGVRVEHAAEIPRAILKTARQAKVRVVMHPGWVRERARRYLETTETAMLPDLHRGRSVLNAGIPVWFGSDAPASEPNPLGAIETAVTRRALDGTIFNPNEAMNVDEAIAASIGGRNALDTAAPGGALAPGARADFIVLDRDPFTVDPENLNGIQVLATYVDGEERWTAPK
jgi:predicted amidohydrolase YtcJ